MDDFLVDLYALTKGAARTPREDFLSLCLGNAVRRDRDLAAAVLRAAVTDRRSDGSRGDRTGEREDRVRAWLLPPASGATHGIDVQSQIAASSGADEHPGWVDLRLLLSGPQPQGVIFEAKVGRSVPSKAQLARYAAALSGDLIVALVQENARSLAKQVPVVTWDEVATALADASGRDHHDVERRQLLSLLAHATVIDPRRGLPEQAWARAVRANDIYTKLLPRLEAMLVQLGPNQAVRQALAADIEARRGLEEASHGWGPGVSRNGAYAGSFISGLTLSVDAGDHPNELVWYIEVYPSRAPMRERMRGREFSAWRPSKGARGWFTTRLYVSRGSEKLAKSDLAEVVRLGRDALRTLHNGTPNAAWPAHGPGTMPNAGQDKSIPQLRSGIRDYEAVYHALSGACCQIVAAIASPGCSVSEAEVKRKGTGWVTTAGPRPVWAGATSDLKRLRVVLLKGSQSDHASLAGVVGAENEAAGAPFAMTVEDVAEGGGIWGPGVTLTLTAANWQSTDLVATVARVVALAS